MESPNFPPPHMDASRPSLGFPLGTALLLIFVFSLSGVFSCFYHWDKLKSLRHSYQHQHHDLESNPQPAAHSPSKSMPSCTDLKQSQNGSLPVLMPGDEIPRFIAMQSPCKPPRPEKVVVKVEKPPETQPVGVPL